MDVVNGSDDVGNVRVFNDEVGREEKSIRVSRESESGGKLCCRKARSVGRCGGADWMASGDRGMGEQRSALSKPTATLSSK